MDAPVPGNTSAMGLLRRGLRTAIPISRVGVALWAWRNRGEIMGWAGYAARSVPRLVEGDTTDVLTEGRVRARLTTDSRTRNADGLSVSVHDGVVTLSGVVDPDVHDAAVDVATRTANVASVRDDLQDPPRRRSFTRR